MINPVLLPLYGPLAIHWYGVMIAIGVIVFVYYTERILQQKKLLSYEQYHQLILYAIIAGIIGGKIMYIITEEPSASATDIVRFFEGGFSILGTVLGIALIMPLFLYSLNKPLAPITDICVSFVPLIQVFGRIGCFLAGCCAGTCTNVAWSVTYSHPQSLAPLGIALHPVQLYSAFLLGVIFLLLQYLRGLKLRSGTISMLYLIFISMERFFIDFWRYDRLMISWFPVLSWYQLVAISIGIVAGILLTTLYIRPHESL